jgi:hypothetical protein
VTRPGRRILVLYWQPPGERLRPAVRHHLEVLKQGELAHRVLYVNTFGGAPVGLWRAPCDAIVLHTTFLCMRWSHLFYTWKETFHWLRDFEGPKIALPQDEYDHSEVLDDWLGEFGATDIFTNFDTATRELLYPRMSSMSAFHKCFTGYIDAGIAERLRASVTLIGARDLDIVYRASQLPFWFGSHGQLKHRVGTATAERAAARGHRIDISTRPEDTIVGEAWFDFLMSGRTVIGCESGSSVLDRRGDVRARIQKLLRDQPRLSFEEIAARMPDAWDDYRFFAMSPRHFEAIITKTCQVLVEGEYEGVLVPWRHYIPLKRDFSNLDEVLESTRDVAVLQRIVDCAYQEIYRGGRYSYQAFARELEAVLLRHELKPARRPSVRGTRETGLQRPFTGLNLKMALWLRRSMPHGTVRGVKAWLKAILVIRLALADAALRKVLGACVGDADLYRTVGVVALVDDLLRLGVLRRWCAGAVEEGFRLERHYDRVHGDLVLVSVPAEKPQERDTSEESVDPYPALGRIVWDHSRAALWVTWSRGARWRIRVGPAGTYVFTALSRIAAKRPEAVWLALNGLGQ